MQKEEGEKGRGKTGIRGKKKKKQKGATIRTRRGRKRSTSPRSMENVLRVNARKGRGDSI